MTEKDRLAAQNTITQGAIAANNAVITTIQHREGVNAQTAGRIFEAGARQSLEGQRQQFEMGQQKERLESQERLTKASIAASAAAANRLPGEVRAAQLLGGGDYEKGLRKMAEISSDKTGQVYAKLYVDHVNDARKAGVDALSPTDFALQTRAVMAAMAPQGPSVVTTKAPVTTGVLQRP